MKRTFLIETGFLCLAATANAQNNQLEIRHNSNVNVHQYLHEETTDTIAGVSAYEPFSLSHSVSYDDPSLDFDPTASSNFSVDSVTFIEPTAPGSHSGFYDITVSGELFRSGATMFESSDFLGSQSELIVDIVGLPGLGSTLGLTIVTQYSLTASYQSTSDQLQYASLPFVLIQKVYADEFNNQDLHALEADGLTGSATFSGGYTEAGALRITVVADALEILIAHGGDTTVTFEGTFRVLTRIPPEPCLADVNGDGEVTPADFSAWVAAFNTQAPECDQNGDGSCTPADFSAWVANFNAGCD